MSADGSTGCPKTVRAVHHLADRPNLKLTMPTIWDRPFAAKDFVRYLMIPDPHQRPSAAQALEHPVRPFFRFTTSIVLLRTVLHAPTSQWICTPIASCPPIAITRPTTPTDQHGPSTHPDPEHPIQVLRKQETLKPGTVEDNHALERHLSRRASNRGVSGYGETM